MLPSIFSENLFDDFFGRDFEKNFFGKGLYGSQNQLMKTDVKENENGYMIDIDLPGFNKEDVNVELKDGYLTVTASQSKNNDEQKEDGRYIRKERYMGSCTRSFYVGNVKPEQVSGRFEKGVLSLNIPKEAPQIEGNPHRVAIE